MATELKPHHKEGLMWVAIIGGGAVIFFVFARSQGSPQQGPQKPTSQPNPANANIAQAIIAARTNALDMFDTSVLGEKSLQEQQNIGYNTNLTQKVIAFNTNRTQLQMTQLATAMQEAIARIQAQTEQNYINMQQSLGQQYLSNQGNSWWQNLLGGLFSGFGGLFSGLNIFGSGSSGTPNPWSANIYQGAYG